MVEIGSCAAVLLFNKEQKNKVDVLKNLGIVSGQFLVSYVNAEDRACVT